MCNIKYKIEFFSDWHCGSGLSAGADVDSLVIKDKNGMPFIPGKTIKGLLKEAVENFIEYSGSSDEEKEAANETFGQPSGEGNPGKAFFSNAELEDDIYRPIVDASLQIHLYRKVAYTKINEKGLAEEHSLRKIQTVIPCILTGIISEVPEGLAEIMVHSFGLVKHIGLSRSRGLGRCQITKID